MIRSWLKADDVNDDVPELDNGCWGMGAVLTTAPACLGVYSCQRYVLRYSLWSWNENKMFICVQLLKLSNIRQHSGLSRRGSLCHCSQQSNEAKLRNILLVVVQSQVEGENEKIKCSEKEIPDTTLEKTTDPEKCNLKVKTTSYKGWKRIGGSNFLNFISFSFLHSVTFLLTLQT